ncbi:hypothetical protein B0H67DRAFT_642726 [Lasiosphaeris hirsuta]|uniref:Uncharacterized protein n=1 Tax=Lasiosphaeris hirsuta TaxID=260670 RepID=A0AA40AP04_9PEZI|nr:hypothetical protein B0H67DRAFT_642726 [Lasiosphaeris hirsuta]
MWLLAFRLYVPNPLHPSEVSITARRFPPAAALGYSSRRPHKEQEQDVVLESDIGSTSTRAVLLSEDSNRVYYVENARRKNLDRRFDPCDFSSTGYPFDGLEPVYLGNNVDADRQRISLKYGMHILANASDVLLEEFYSPLKLLISKGREGVSRYMIRAFIIKNHY